MKIVQVAMAFYGFIGTSASIAGAIGNVISRVRDCSAEHLFKRCFKRALKRRSLHLSQFTAYEDLNTVRVKDDVLDQILSDLEVAEPSLLGASEKQDILDFLSPKFRSSILLPGHNLSEKKLDYEISFVLSDALADFYHQLPLTDKACKEMILATIKSQNIEQVAQKEFRKRVDENLKNMIAVQEDIAKTISYLDPIVIQKESGRPEFKNPFRIVKAEEFDHNYPLLVSLFKQPENYELIRGRDNLILYGARGCGKSMILRSLTAPAAVEIEGKSRSLSNFTFKEAGLDYFGVYIKLAKGYFDNWKPDYALTYEAATQLFQHVFNLQLLKATMDALLFSRDRYKILSFSLETERLIAGKILHLLGIHDSSGEGFAELRNIVVQKEVAVGNYLGDLRLGERQSYSAGYTYVSDFPREFCRIIVDSISELDGSRIYFLLDEFENLAEFQQTIVNTITKLRPDSLTIKLASRALGLKSSVDLQGEPIQSPRDYKMVSLDYDINDSHYTDLLFEISKKRLQKENFVQDNIRKLLPSFPKYSEFGEERVIELVTKYLKVHRGIDFSECTEADQKEWLHRMDFAVIFREAAAQNRRYPRRYSGFKTLVDLSSGIISNFLELCKMAFYLSESSGQDVRGGKAIDPTTQSEAVYLVSRASLDWIPRNIPKTGPSIARLILDLADIFREKLLKHNTEPEAARLVIKDPENLGQKEFEEVAKVINDAVRWSVLHASGASGSYFPKHKTDVRPDDFYLNSARP